MDEHDLKDWQRWLFRNLVWILIIISLILMLISYLDLVSNSKLTGIIEKASLAMLSSGIFAAVLKSLQFQGLFKEEINKVINGTDFLKKRKDLPDIWRVISKEIYKSKFPLITQFLENRILETYFPTETEYYYKDYYVTINIEDISEDMVITYSQTCKYTVVLDSNLDKSELILESKIDQEGEEAAIINDLEFFFVNEEDKTPKEEDKLTIENNKRSQYTIPIAGKGDIKIHSKYNRKYSLKGENYKLFRLKYFTQNMEVVINHPENVSVSFFNIGLVNKFESQHVGIKNTISRTHKNDLILPHQGFGMSFERNNIIEK